MRAMENTLQLLMSLLCVHREEGKVMNKRLLISMLFIICLVSNLSAVLVPDLSRAIKLQGALGEVLSISVEPLSAQTSSYRFGMPFDIQDASVQYSSAETLGRPIAHWTVLANTPFTITVQPADENNGKLVHVSETSTSLDYILTFSYNLDYYVKGEAHSASGQDFIYKTNETLPPFNSDEVIRNKGEDGYSLADEKALTGSVDGTIYFRFAKGQEGIIDDNEKVPAGNYEAKVKLILEAAE